MKRIKKLLSYAILLGGIALLPACGGGDYGVAAADDSSNQTFVEPVKSGVLLSSGLNGRSVVGETYEGKLYVTPIDSRNQITSYAVSNPTTGGAVPTVSAAGTVTWVPNAIDINTPALKVVVTQAQGETPTSNLTVPVSVYAKTLEMTADIVPDQAFYSDPEGVYSVQIGSRSGTMPTGKILVYSYKSAAGNVSYSIEPTIADVFGILRDYPRTNSLLSGLTTQSSTGKQVANAASGMHPTENEMVEYGVEAVGSLFYDYAAEKNLYTLRQGQMTTYTGTLFPETALTNQQIIQIDSNCSLSASAVNKCKKALAPVILIHGFTPETFGIGGGEGTWGIFPKRLQESSHDVFEFRWLTHIRFEEAAGQLTKLINKVAWATGKKPIVIAHSFGGIVGHLALSGQGIEWRNEQWEKVKLGNKTSDLLASDVVDKLITLGSPIGGIYGGSGRELPGMEWGRQLAEWSITTCQSITCLQAGATEILRTADFKRALAAIVTAQNPPVVGHLTTEMIGEQLAWQNYDGLLNYAETIARIGKIRTGNGPVDRIIPASHDANTVAFVGVGTKAFDAATDDISILGDGLISLKGQIHPNDVANLSSFFDRSNFSSLKPNSLRPVASQNIPTMRYIFLPNAKHTALQELTSGMRFEYPEAYLQETNHVNYCDGISYRRTDALIGRFGLGPVVCNGAIATSTHPLMALILSNDYLNKDALGYFGNVKAQWPMSGKVSVANASVTTAASDVIAFSLEIRNRATGDKLLKTFAYATQVDGSFRIDLNELLDTNLPNFDRANLFATIFLGDNVSYTVQKVSIQNLNLDEIVVPEITLIRKNALPGLIDVSGKVIDGQSLGAGIADATIYLRKGVNLSANDLLIATSSYTSRVAHTDTTGKFYVNGIRPGTYSAMVRKTGYVDEVQGQLTVSANGVISLSLLKVLAPGEASVTLRWDTAAGGASVVSDLDSHMLRFNATGALDHHIFYSARLGLDGDSLDRDDTNYEGPETVTFNPKSTKNYVYYVHQFSSAGTIPGSKPLVTVRLGSQAYRFDLPVSASTTGRYWRVFDMVNGQVRPCTANCLQTAAPNTITTQSGALAQLSADVRPYMSSMPAKQ